MNVWRDALMFDCGDAFSDVDDMSGDRLANGIATAGLIIDRYNAEGLTAQSLGDRDLALGRAALETLKLRAHYPFITTNLVDVASGKTLFSPFEIVEAGRGDQRVKIAVFGLMTARQTNLETTMKLRVVPALEAMKTALPAAKAKGAEMFIVLSQLMSRDAAALSEAMPELQLFLGDDFGSMSPEPDTVGKALAFASSQKGKHVAFMTLKLDDPAGAGAPFVDPKRRDSLERKKTDAQRRVDNYTRLLDEANKPVTPRPDDKPSPTLPIDVYQRQLAAAKAELQLASDDLAAIGDAKSTPANAVTFELVQLSREVADDPAVKALVDEFRKTYPDPTPGGH